MKRIVLTFILVAFSVSAQAQMAKVQTAISLFNSYQVTQDLEELMKAKEAIDLGMDNEKSKINSKTWLYAGHIYTELSRQDKKPELNAQAVQDAFSFYKKVQELEEASGKKPKNSKESFDGLLNLKPIFYNVGYGFFEKENYDDAYGYFQKTLDIDDMARNNPYTKNKQDTPVDTNTIFATALAAERGGLKTEAITLLQQLVDLDYKEASIYQVLSNLYKDAGETALAQKVMDKARVLFPNNSALVIDEINRLLKDGNEDGALEKMKEAIRLDPENASLMFAVGSVYDKAGKGDLAIENYKKALALDADYFDAYYNLGVVYYNQAAKKTQEMNELDLNDQANYDRLKGESESLFKEALPHFENAMKLQPNDRNNLIALKEIYARLGMNDEYSAVSDKLKEIGDQ